MAEIREAATNLARLDYNPALDTLLATLLREDTQLPTPMQCTEHLQVLRPHSWALFFAKEAARKRVGRPFGGGRDVRTATTHATDAHNKQAAKRIAKLDDVLAAQFATATAALRQGLTPHDYLATLSCAADDPAINAEVSKDQLSFACPLHKTERIKYQRLSPRPQAGAAGQRAMMGYHTVRITVAPLAPLMDQLHDAAFALLEQAGTFLSEADRDDAEDLWQEGLGKPVSPLRLLQRVVQDKLIAQCQKQVGLRYLEACTELLSAPAHAAARADLALIAARAQRILDWVYDTQRPLLEELVTYDRRQYRLSEELALANALQPLPIIGTVDEYALNATGDAARVYEFGLHVKGNGKVQSVGVSSFRYHLGHMAHPEGLGGYNAFRTLLRWFPVFYVIFSRFDEPEADTMADFATQVLPQLRDLSDADKLKLIAEWGTGLLRDASKIEQRLTAARDALRTMLRTKKLGARRWQLDISILPTVFETDMAKIRTSQSLIKSDLFPDPGRPENRMLRYIVVTPSAVDRAVVKLQASAELVETRYYPATDKPLDLYMTHTCADLRVLPIVAGASEHKGLLRKALPHERGVMVQASSSAELAGLSSDELYWYQFAYELLSYLLLEQIKRVLPRTTYMAQLRLHSERKEKGDWYESYWRGLCKVQMHLLNSDHLANTQGLCVSDSMSASLPYRQPNGLYSLYSLVDKQFMYTPHWSPATDRVAVVMVSSRECDSTSSAQFRYSVVFGEAWTVRFNKEGHTADVGLLQTFTDRCASDEIHTKPAVLLDLVHRLYQDGYRHIIYMARAPYSNSLRVATAQDDASLFFMNPSLIDEMLRGKDDLHVYPVYCGEHPAVALGMLDVHSLYAHEVKDEHEPLAGGMGQRVARFFEIFTGYQVQRDRKEETTFYNAVMTYAAVRNMQSIRQDSTVVAGLLVDGPLRETLLYVLMFMHFARYEAAPLPKRPLRMKLDPYASVVGEDAVAKVAAVKYPHSSTERNVLAWLAEVRDIVHKHQYERARGNGPSG